MDLCTFKVKVRNILCTLVQDILRCSFFLENQIQIRQLTFNNEIHLSNNDTQNESIKNYKAKLREDFKRDLSL